MASFHQAAPLGAGGATVGVGSATGVPPGVGWIIVHADRIQMDNNILALRSKVLHRIMLLPLVLGHGNYEPHPNPPQTREGTVTRRISFILLSTNLNPPRDSPLLL